MEQLAIERCVNVDKWIKTAMDYENEGDLDLARETLLTYHYLSKKSDNFKDIANHKPIYNELEIIESKILVKLTQKIPTHHTQLFFPSLLSIDPYIPGIFLPGQVVNTIKPLATVTVMEAEDLQDNYLSAYCGMCGKFCVTKSPTARIPGVSILLGRRIACQYNCGVSYCSDICYLQHSNLHGTLCRILPDFLQQICQLGLCKYRSLLALKTLASNAVKLKGLWGQKIGVKQLGIPILGDLSQILFKVTNVNSEVMYTRQEILQLFTIVYCKAVTCNIADVPIDLPFSAFIKCKIWVFSPNLLQYIITEVADGYSSYNKLATSWQNGKVYLRTVSESEISSSKFYIQNDEDIFENEAKIPGDYRCRFCIVGFCKAGVCTSCNNSSVDDATVDVCTSANNSEDNLMFLMSKYGYDSPNFLRSLLTYIDSKQLGPFSYSKDITKFLIRSALCLLQKCNNFGLQLLSHSMGKLAKLLSMDNPNGNLLHISMCCAYNYYKLHGESCLGVIEMREIAATCGINWINCPLKFSVSDSSLLDGVGKKVYGPSTFTPFPPDCNSSIVTLAFAASRTLIAAGDPLFGVVKGFVLELEKLGVIHLPTGLTPLGLALMARNDPLLCNLGLEPANTPDGGNGSKYHFHRTLTPLIVTILKFEMGLSDSKGQTVPISSYLHKLINLIEDKKEFVDARTSEIEGLETAMHYAAWTNNLSLMKLLVKYGAIVNPLSGLGLTPFDLAASAGHMNVVKYLFESECGVISSTSLFLACCSLKVDMIKYLLGLCGNNSSSRVLSVDNLPMYFGLVWHGIAFTVCKTDYYETNINKSGTISRLNDAVSVVKMLCDWGFKGTSILDGKLPSETVKSLSVKFLEAVSISGDQLHYASVAQSFIYLGHLLESIEGESYIK